MGKNQNESSKHKKVRQFLKELGESKEVIDNCIRLLEEGGNYSATTGHGAASPPSVDKEALKKTLVEM